MSNIVFSIEKTDLSYAFANYPDVLVALGLFKALNGKFDADTSREIVVGIICAFTSDVYLSNNFFFSTSAVLCADGFVNKIFVEYLGA